MQAQTGWRFYGWWGIVLPAFVVIWITNALTLAGIAVFDRAILDELELSRGALKFGDTLQLLASAALAPVGGWIADRFGVRPAMIAGALLLAGGLYAYSMIDSLTHLYLLRVVLGASLAGAGLVVCVTIVSRWFVSRRGLALGLMLSGTSLGNALIPQLNTWLIGQHGWREALQIVCLIPLLLLPIVLFVIKEWPERVGLAPLGAAAAAAPGAGGQRGVPMAGYDFAPALRTANFWLIATAAFCTFYSILGLSGNLFLHMQDLGYDAAGASRAFFPLFIMGLVGKLAAGAISELLPRKLVFALCLGFMLAGALMLATLKPSLVWPALWLFGFGWGGNYTMLQALVADVFGARSLGKILGAITVIDATGGAIGPWITGMTYDATNDYGLGFGIMTALIAVAFVAAMLVRTPARPER
ncbi:MAG: MFS transporter [Steroidobacteraceae bacterium]|jgi:MFS family permease|nr:MFS transporter [Steroidobacteraceae bacterium]